MEIFMLWALGMTITDSHNNDVLNKANIDCATSTLAFPNNYTHSRTALVIRTLANRTTQDLKREMVNTEQTSL